MTISLHFLDSQEKTEFAHGDHLLGALTVGRAEPRLGHPVLSVDLDVLAVDGLVATRNLQLRTSKPLKPVQEPDPPAECASFRIAQTDEHLFGVLELNPQADIRAASYRAYKALLQNCEALGKPNLLRIWNYLPHINALENGEERYRLFNAGRHQALTESNYLARFGAPAACALGSHRGVLKIAFLAASRPATPIENSRQISAYNYPESYGLKPPVFSRAAWFAQEDGRDILFLSGTASIVGHQSLHPGDAALQTHETLKNIEAVLLEANRMTNHRFGGLKNLHGQVFVRNPADRAIIQHILRERELVNFSYVHADICRADLLVEIEAYAQL